MCTVGVNTTPRLCGALGVANYFFDSTVAEVSTLAALALVLALFEVDLGQSFAIWPGWLQNMQSFNFDVPLALFFSQFSILPEMGRGIGGGQL